MRSWKRRTRYQHRQRLKAWKSSELKYDQRHRSPYIRKRVKRGNFDKETLKMSHWEAWWSPIWRKRYALRWKRDIRRVIEAMLLFAKFPYIEDCRYHPCKVTNLKSDPDYGRIDFDCESLINGKPNSCSYFHCGVVHLTKEEGEERAQFARDYGMLPYQLRWVYNTKELTLEQNTNSIRAQMKQDGEWKFNENGGTEMYTEKGREWIQEKLGIDVSALTPMTDEEMEKLYG